MKSQRRQSWNLACLRCWSHLRIFWITSAEFNMKALEVVKMDNWDQMIWHLTKEVSDEIKKWDCCAGGAAEAIVALPVHMGARRVNPESIKGWKLDLRRITSGKGWKLDEIWKKVGQRLDEKNLLGAAPQLALVLTSIHPLGTACNQNFNSFILNLKF